MLQSASRWGGLLPGRVPGPGGSAPGGVSQHALRQTPLPPVDRHTPVKILPWPNFVAAGKYTIYIYHIWQNLPDHLSSKTSFSLKLVGSVRFRTTYIFSHLIDFILFHWLCWGKAEIDEPSEIIGRSQKLDQTILWAGQQVTDVNRGFPKIICLLFIWFLLFFYFICVVPFNLGSCKTLGHFTLLPFNITWISELKKWL